MTYRAVVQNGLIVVNTHGELPDGTRVEVSIEKKTRAKKPVAKKSRSRSAKNRGVPGYGMWADRNDLGTSETAVTRLRASTRRRRIG